MSDRARDLANLLLVEGSLRRDDLEHKRIYEELMGDMRLYEEVKQRLEAVSFELVQELGHLGVRLSRAVDDDLASRNRIGLHAGHVRMILWLWVQLVYREWNDLRRGLKSGAPGQSTLFAQEQDEAPWISYQQVLSDFGERNSVSHIKGLLQALRRWRFIRYDEKRDRIWADASLYIQVDRARAEDFVIDLARRVGVPSVDKAVKDVATGSPMAPESDKEAP